MKTRAKTFLSFQLTLKMHHFSFAGVANTTSFEQLEQLASNLVDQAQTGGLSRSLNITVQNFVMAEPVPKPVDPTGGVRATNESGSSFCRLSIIGF